MLPRLSGPFLVIGAVAAGCLVLAQSSAPRRDVAKVWSEYCASCHGANMSGAQAPTMLDDVWTSGNDDAALAATIRNGRVASGMPAFGTMLSDRDIHAMVVYIRETAGRAKAAATTYAAPAPNVDDQEREARVQAGDRRRRRAHAVGPRLPARRSHAGG